MFLFCKCFNSKFMVIFLFNRLLVWTAVPEIMTFHVFSFSLCFGALWQDVCPVLTLGLAVLALCLTWCGAGAGVSLSPIADWLHLSFTLFASAGEKWYSANSCMWEIFLIALANISISLCHKQVKWNTFIITMRHRRATIYLQTAMEKTERKQIMLVNYQRPHIQLLPVKI